MINRLPVWRPADLCCADLGGGWSGNRPHLLVWADWLQGVVPLWWPELQCHLQRLPELLGIHHCPQHNGAHFSLCQVSGFVLCDLGQKQSEFFCCRCPKVSESHTDLCICLFMGKSPPISLIVLNIWAFSWCLDDVRIFYELLFLFPMEGFGMLTLSITCFQTFMDFGDPKCSFYKRVNWLKIQT